MVDPITIVSGAIGAIKVCNSAYGQIKQLLENGSSLASAGSALSKWFDGADKIEKAARQKTSPTDSNASAQAIQLLAARTEIREQRAQLISWLRLHAPAGAADEFLSLERDFRLAQKKERDDAVQAKYKRIEKLKQIFTAGLLVFGFSLIIGIAVIVYLNINLSPPQ